LEVEEENIGVSDDFKEPFHPSAFHSHPLAAPSTLKILCTGLSVHRNHRNNVLGGRMWDTLSVELDDFQVSEIEPFAFLMMINDRLDVLER